ncbi:N-formylglutamate amidohydrolase [Erythrobacter sp. SG61-1L]|uniref:N-formylglutamate amidohydrolase n=1 Tax=Erythrobacter sp. SG61-1L TaxID=1603897 RepID=UPI0006C9330A|nr:N-formylglutamate amidohydrolase [Erythrobacter sp. SG61-1L]
MGDNPITRESGGFRGGAIPGCAGQPAFTLTSHEPSPIPVLLAVPHAGRLYPPALIGQLRNPGEASLRLEDRYVDLLASAVARETGAALLIAHAPRAMIDLNRAPDEMDWDMLRLGTPPGRQGERVSRRARSGLGLVPRRLAGMGELWRSRLDEAELEARLEGVHRPYHEAISGSLSALRTRWGAALLVDMHSMPPLGPRGPGEPAPEIVLGDRFGATCDGALCAAAFDELNRQRRIATHNRPYAGGYVLDRHAAPGRGIHAVQVEVCRSTYLDRRLAEPVEAMAAMVTSLVALVRRLAAETAALGRGAQLAQAAE